MGVQMPPAPKAKNRKELENCRYLATCPGQMFDISKSKISKRKAALQHLLPWNYLIHSARNWNKYPCCPQLLVWAVPKNHTKKVCHAVKVVISLPQDRSALTVSLRLLYCMKYKCGNIQVRFLQVSTWTLIPLPICGMLVKSALKISFPLILRESRRNSAEWGKIRQEA